MNVNKVLKPEVHQYIGLTLSRIKYYEIGPRSRTVYDT